MVSFSTVAHHFPPAGHSYGKMESSRTVFVMLYLPSIKSTFPWLYLRNSYQSFEVQLKHPLCHKIFSNTTSTLYFLNRTENFLHTYFLLFIWPPHLIVNLVFSFFLSSEQSLSYFHMKLSFIVCYFFPRFILASSVFSKANSIQYTLCTYFLNK